MRYGPAPEKDRDHTLNVWLSLLCIVLAVAGAIVWRTWNNPSLEARRIGFVPEKLATLATGTAGPRPAGAETCNLEAVRQ